MQRTGLLTTLTLLAALLAPPALGQGVRPSDVVEGQLRPGWQASNGTQIMAVHLRLARDWITYWRHPGESGIVPELDWSASRNLAQVHIHWPEPRLFMKAGYNSIGYKDEVIVPLELTPVDPSAPIHLDAMLSIGVCDDICIPVDLNFRADVAGAGKMDRSISDVLSARPKTARQAGLRDIACGLQPQSKGAMLEVEMTMPVMGQTEFLLIEFPGVQAQTRVLPSHRESGRLVGQTFLRAKDGRLPAIDRSSLSITVVSENGAVKHQGCTVGR